MMNAPLALFNGFIAGSVRGNPVALPVPFTTQGGMILVVQETGFMRFVEAYTVKLSEHSSGFHEHWQEAVRAC